MKERTNGEKHKKMGCQLCSSFFYVKILLKRLCKCLLTDMIHYAHNVSIKVRKNV